MRKVTISGCEHVVNPLKGKDIRALREKGIDPLKGSYVLSDGMDAVFTASGLDLDAVDEMPFPDVLKLHKAIMDETFGVPEEEKNS